MVVLVVISDDKYLVFLLEQVAPGWISENPIIVAERNRKHRNSVRDFHHIAEKNSPQKFYWIFISACPINYQIVSQNQSGCDQEKFCAPFSKFYFIFKFQCILGSLNLIIGLIADNCSGTIN